MADLRSFVFLDSLQPQLAAYLGTSRQQLNNWLSKKREPSGRYVLDMQRWLASKKPKN